MQEVKNLPEWAKERGHPKPAHRYYLRDDGALMVRCPQEPADLNLWVWPCACEEINDKMKDRLQEEADRKFEREAEKIEREYENGEIDLEEYRERMEELERDEG